MYSNWSAPFLCLQQTASGKDFNLVLFLILLRFNTAIITLCAISQASCSFWKRKSQDKAAKAPRVKTKVIKRAAKKKTAESSEPPEDVGDSAEEVKFDSLDFYSYILLIMIIPRMMRRPAM